MPEKKKTRAPATKAAGGTRDAALNRPKRKSTTRKMDEAGNTVMKTEPSRVDGTPVVGIGASAGGLEAFEAFFRNMPPDAGMAFVLVAHLDPSHVSLMPELIQKVTPMKVVQAGDGMKAQPNSVYVIPPNKDLSLLHGTLQLLDLPEPRGLRLPIDTFFRSLAQDQGRRAICIILSGTGSDGTLGLKAIKGEGGMVMVQDEESAKYDGMPRNAIATGFADFVLPPAEMPGKLIEYVRRAVFQTAELPEHAEKGIPDAVQKILILLRAKTGHDFSLYKKNTLQRRIERRLHVQQIDAVEDYVRYLQESPHELDILFRELLIGVTSFFRDSEAFDALKAAILTEVLADKPHDYAVRAWIPGCSSGEEAYSIAIILHECAKELNRSFPVQVFGTDIDEDAVQTARAGFYPAAIAADVAPERLTRYFSKEEDGYRVRKVIREMLVFAPQSATKDPPFTKLDLLSCRNLMIYLEAELQKRLLPMFHYSLKPGGILFLGSAETIGVATDLFSPVNRKWKIFRRKPGTRSTTFPWRHSGHLPVEAPPQGDQPGVTQQIDEVNTVKLLESILQQADTPPCAIIDEFCNILYIHGRTGAYLEPAVGKVSVNILDMARPGLKQELSAAIRSVLQNREEVAKRNLRIRNNGEEKTIDLTVRPMPGLGARSRLMMTVFQEVAAPGATRKKVPARKKTHVGKGGEVERLTKELKAARESHQSTIEELETSNEELTSANEELQSTNEELQSTNEELETSKEELQSLNEESTTVNVELQSRIDELSEANDDLKNLLESTQIATIFLDEDLNVRRFTPGATNIIPLTPVDIGRAIDHFATRLKGIELRPLAEKVLRELAVEESEVQSNDGSVYRMRQRPYRTTNNVIAGVVITFEDITAIAEARTRLREARRFADNIVDGLWEPILVLTADLTVLSANQAFYEFFRTESKETIGRKFFELGGGAWDIAALARLRGGVLSLEHAVEDFVIEHKFPQIGLRKISIRARQVPGNAEEGPMILLALGEKD